jgi:hypothetical protein
MRFARFRIRTLMVAIAISAAAISVVRTTPARIGGWEAAIVWRESCPLVVLFHQNELADWRPHYCNSGRRWDAAYEIRPSALAVVTALGVGFCALTIQAGVKLRRMRRALTESHPPIGCDQSGGPKGA